MKKSLIVILFVFLLLINFISAIDFESVERANDKIGEVLDSPDEIAKDYVWSEWSSTLEGNSVGRFLVGLSEKLKLANPIFNLIFGVEYSLSWVFFLSVFLWIFVFVFVSFLIKAFFAREDILNFSIGFFISFISAQLGLFVKAVELVSPWLDNGKVILVLVLCLTLLLSVYVRLMKSLADYTEKAIKKEKKEEEEIREELEYELKKSRSEIRV